MAEGYLVTLADSSLDPGDDIAGNMSTFTESETLGTGSWMYDGNRIHDDHSHYEEDVFDTGSYQLGTDGNVYFVPDTYLIDGGTGVAIDVPQFVDDDVVSGSSGDDVIDAVYTGDPDGDVVDGADGDDDIIDALDGDDAISAGEGQDTIYGGAGSDTIFGGAEADLIYGDRTLDPQYSSSNISIENASFEDNILGEDQWQVGISEWTTSSGAGAGVWNPTSASLDVGTVTGQNVSYLYDDGDSISQVLSQTYQDGNTYQFHMDIGDSYEGSANFTVNIYAGPTVIGTVTGETGDEDQLDALTVSTNGYSDPALTGQPLTLEIVLNTGGVLSVDAVTGEVLTLIDPDETPSGNDSIDGEDGNDTIDGGAGNDTIDGGADDDTILMSAGTDTVSGGSGTDTYDANSGSGSDGETIQVSVSGTGPTGGSGTATKTVDGTTDTLAGIEEIIAGEADAETDGIVVTGLVDHTNVSGLDDDSTGVFTPSWGSSGPISFGGAGEPTLSDLLSFGYDPGTGAVHPVGTFQITSGDESGTVGDITFQNFETIEFSTICFARGTLIETSKGRCAVETMAVGDLVATADRGFQPIRWVHVDEKSIDSDDDYPILIKAGSLGPGRPLRDLIVSKQHRILVGEFGQLEDYFENAFLVPAKALTGLPGIRQMSGKKKVDWWHFACDGHEIIEANGAHAETLLVGKMVLNGLSWPERIELHGLYGVIDGNDGALNGPPARALQGAAKTRHQIKRVKNGLVVRAGCNGRGLDRVLS